MHQRPLHHQQPLLGSPWQPLLGSPWEEEGAHHLLMHQRPLHQCPVHQQLPQGPLGLPQHRPLQPQQHHQHPLHCPLDHQRPLQPLCPGVEERMPLMPMHQRPLHQRPLSLETTWDLEYLPSQLQIDLTGGMASPLTLELAKCQPRGKAPGNRLVEL